MAIIHGWALGTCFGKRSTVPRKDHDLQPSSMDILSTTLKVAPSSPHSRAMARRDR